MAQHQKGLYTDMAKKAAEEAAKNGADALNKFRQW